MGKHSELLNHYISSISSKFSHEETSEMGYRTDFEVLIKGIFEEINVRRIDHDAKAKDGNKPDFAVLKNDIPILYIEAKDIGVSLDKVEKSEQMSRYYGYTNLVLTDYLEFRFYRNGLPYGEPIKIASFDLRNRIISPNTDTYDNLSKTLLDFAQSQKEPIKSGKHLSKIMAGKAQRIRDNVKQFLSINSEKNAELNRIYESIKKLLVHDLSKDAFADMYAQTLVYGLFVARYEDTSPNNFTRQEARDLIPASNPFLRHFFDHIVGPDFDKRLEYIVNELCEVFSHANIPDLMKEYFKTDLWGETHKGPDPVIHFYEDFLKEYDPELRKKMGAFYTPLPVVQFIVRSVDYLLKKDFGLSGGLSDTSKTSNGIHKVQILDPAVGTGTFISKIILNIYESIKASGQEGRWHPYVLHDLLPRLYGFELMMTPYTIAHLKLSLSFKETGFKYFNNRRLGIYLTNALEDSTDQEGLFNNAFGLAESIADESKEATKIKRQKPIMVVIGNPPYSGESSNKSYHGNDVYKFEPSGGKLQERNSKWLNDDYVKFIRFAESMIEKTGEGIMAMITAHGYIENPTFRGMRWHLMKSFDEIYILDLHGNSNKKEESPDGSEDKNVFDIKTGVSIIFGLKKQNSKSEISKIFKSDLYGKRSDKFNFLNNNLINTVQWKHISPSGPNYEWTTQNEPLKKEYLKGFSIDELFITSSVGIVTSRDEFVIDSNKQLLAKRIQDFLASTPQEAKLRFNLKENKSWKIVDCLRNNFDEANIVPISYRPFDPKYIYYDDNFIERSRKNVMKHFLREANFGLVTARSNKNPEVDHFFVSKYITEAKLGESSTQSAIFPLYLYADDGKQISNLKEEIFDSIKIIVQDATPEKIFDYIYAVLYSPLYREKYRDLLKKDFPRVPYPKNEQDFNTLVNYGSELRSLHLMESTRLSKLISTYPISGSDEIEKVEYINGKVHINNTQYFGDIPEYAWEFSVGGYQPAQKWLKDRKGEILTNEDLEYYQKIIIALVETDKIMKEIDLVLSNNG